MTGNELNPFRGMALGLHNHVVDDECTDDCSFYPAPDVVTGEVVEPDSPRDRVFFPAWREFEDKGFRIPQEFVTRLIEEGGTDVSRM